MKGRKERRRKKVTERKGTKRREENEERRRVHKTLKVQISSSRTATVDSPELESGNER